VTGTSRVAEALGEPGNATRFALPSIGFLVAFSAVYYAMLVYAPHQVAEREGGVVTWLLRYALFVAGVTFGLVWPRVFTP
jgi:hypothetical protein